MLMEIYPENSMDTDAPVPESKEVDDSRLRKPSNTRVKFLCSYGGRIQPRTHDNRLVYSGGETKILSVDRLTSFSGVISKLSSLSRISDLCLKYQLPGEDLDSLISVTNDDDLEHLMVENNNLNGSRKLRLFLFNAGRINSPPALNPDFLFGFDDMPENSSERKMPTENLDSRFSVSERPENVIPAAAGYNFPPPPPPPAVTVGFHSGSLAGSGYYPVVMGPMSGYLGVSSQGIFRPVNAGQPVYYAPAEVHFSRDGPGYEIPVTENDEHRQSLLPEMRGGKPPLPV